MSAAVTEAPGSSDGTLLANRWNRWLPVLLALAAFGSLCVVVLSRPTALLEPDDFAYRASIQALMHGQVVLTDAQYQALASELAQAGPGSAAGPGGGSIMQWVQLPDGHWVSEKNPGYPFLAWPFAAVGALRLAPLFYGALACIALYAGARRWLGRWGGTAVVALYCTSGAAMVFAWRPTMPTFTDASLVAAGAGALLWAYLARDRSDRARISAGLAGFVALEAAVAVRYTNVVFLGVAVVVALMAPRWAGLPRRSIAWWWGSVAAMAAALLAWNQAVYGSPLTTGYASGLITFSLESIAPNLQKMPGLLVRAIPMIVLAVLAVGWAVARWLRDREDAARVRDLLVVGVLTVGWLGLWAVYSAYDWTAQGGGPPGGTRADAGAGASAGGAEQNLGVAMQPPTGGGPGGPGVDDLAGSVHLIRFYIPALGLIALLAAWVLVRLPFWLAAAAVAGQFGLGIWAFDAMATLTGPGGMGGPGAPSGPGGTGGPGGGPGAPPGGFMGPGGPGGGQAPAPPNGFAPAG